MALISSKHCLDFLQHIGGNPDDIAAVFGAPTSKWHDERIELSGGTAQENTDLPWAINSGAFVFLMLTSFLCLISALTRRKNSISVAIRNLAVYRSIES
jgi:hypothetical protein